MLAEPSVQLKLLTPGSPELWQFRPVSLCNGTRIRWASHSLCLRRHQKGRPQVNFGWYGIQL